ncbi:MAG: ribbon-helix-helix domain-containing protein [Candidatus Aenigmatarchaeota archaeon]
MGNLKNKTKIIPIKFDGALVEILDNLVESGLYATKAEAVRAGLRLLIEKHEIEVKKK